MCFYNVMLVGIVVNLFLLFCYIEQLMFEVRVNFESIMQYSTLLIMNVVIVLLLVLCLFYGGSKLKRWMLLVCFVLLLIVYFEVK